MARILLLIVCVLIGGCSGGAVVFAPTPPPPDQAPVRYTHPSSTFSVNIPRGWALHEQNTTTLASAAFSAPGDPEAAVIFGVINIGSELDELAFADLITRYQTQVRSDVDEYVESSREAMGDGSWRMTGYRRVASGFQPVNTFMQREGSLIGLVEVNVTDDPIKLVQIEQVVNTFDMNPSAASALESSELTTLTFAKGSSLSILHVTAWTTPSGVFFISGEVANYGTSSVPNVPVEVRLLTNEGLPITGAVDAIMARAIPPGGFAPFALRFGEGQPALAAQYALILGGENWDSSIQPPEINAPDELMWTDTSRFDNLNNLIVSGEVTNIGARTLRDLIVSVTVFNDLQQVIGAGFLEPATPLSAGETIPFEILMPELGDLPQNYIVNVQGIP
jgi:hypothetical protein